MLSRGRRGMMAVGVRLAAAMMSAAVLMQVNVATTAHRPVVIGMNGMVASNNPLASEVGMTILKQGGNAFDAAVATAAAVGVAEPVYSGPGGEGFLLESVDRAETWGRYGRPHAALARQMQELCRPAAAVDGMMKAGATDPTTVLAELRTAGENMEKHPATSTGSTTRTGEDSEPVSGLEFLPEQRWKDDLAWCPVFWREEPVARIPRLWICRPVHRRFC